MKNVIVERVIHDMESRVTLRFPYDTELNSLVKGFPGAQWSNKMKCWYVPDNPGMNSKVEELLKGKAILHFSDPKHVVNSVMVLPEELMIKNQKRKIATRKKLKNSENG